ncbi:hypothetical protein M413DRAFT_446434 [Hebeloma cylindrosporum]|uniref:Uncharacterized protein n=1 Tax=Hebeloma cylindrosporum TaxID=76867 RepID=A0A0C3C9K7_HEBCY|nr:hypothetical protein M413DRAFT_446434 [Hebeloma cylindrosporum h7]
MKQMEMPPPFLSTVCITCKRVVQYELVGLDEDGNQGRLLAKCLNEDPFTHARCNFMHWHADFPYRAPTSLCLPSPPSIPIIVDPLVSVVPAANVVQVQPILGPSRISCITLGCKSTRIRRDCGRRSCKAHCLEAGGCQAPAHRGSTTETMRRNHLTPPATLSSTTGLASPSNVVVVMPTPGIPLQIDPTLQATVPPQAPSAAPPSTSIDARANPQFASHMSSVFTEQWATEQRLREEQRERDSARLRNLQKTKHTILLYVWLQDHVQPTVVEFQDGFTWPHFVLDDSVISLAGLAPLPPHHRFNIYRPSLGIWTVVSLGHVVEVNENSRVFVKSTDVQHCKNLTEHSITPTCQFRGRLDVTRERTYTRQRLLQDELANLSPSTSSSRVTPKRKARREDELSPSVRRTRHRLTIQSPDTSEGDTQVRPFSWDGFAHQPLLPPTTSKEREPHTPSTNTHHSESEIESSHHPIHPPCSREPVTVNNSSPPCHFRGDVVQQPPIADSSKTWPTDFYVFEIVKGFEEIERVSRFKGFNIKKAFEAHFSLPYARSTFYEHRARWTSSSPIAKASALAAGATPSGLWKSFMVDNPAPRAATKAARRRVHHAVDQVADSDEGDSGCEESD